MTLNIHKCLGTAAMSLALCCICACSHVKYHEPYGEESSALSFNYMWPDNLDQDLLPSTTTILMTRVKSQIEHYSLALDSQGLSADAADESLMNVKNGSYLITGYASVEDGEYHISGLDGFKESYLVNMKDLFVIIPELTQSEIQELDVLDFNPGIAYIKDVSPLYFVRSNNDIVYGVPSSEGQNIKWEQLTTRMRFGINMNIEESVLVRSVKGVVSGLLTKAYVTSGYVSGEDTGKTCFEMTASGKDPVTGNSYYEGQINSLGIIASSDPKYISGDGIFNIIIEAMIEGNEESLRVFNVTFNLKDMIDEMQILERVSSKELFYRLRKFDCTFAMSNILNVTRDAVLSEAEGGLDVWIESDGTENGLNPEI